MDAACFFALLERCHRSRMLQELGTANLLCAYVNAHLPEGEEPKSPADFMIHKPPEYQSVPAEVPEGLPDPEEALLIFRNRQSAKLLKYKAQAQALGEPIQ